MNLLKKENESCFTSVPTLSDLLLEDISKDVTFLVGPSKSEVRAHKNVLALISPVFKAQFFESGLKECQERVTICEIKEIEQEIMSQLVKCCYTRKVPEISLELQLELLTAADKYMITSLKDSLTSIIIKSINKESCGKIIELTS